MVVRDEAELEVFVLRRTTSAVFAGGMYVFPGGKVDAADGGPDIEPYCDGLDDATASAALGVEHGGLAYFVAAVRECFEEAGILLARRSDGGPVVPTDADRHAVHAGELSMVELCRRDGLVLELTAVRYVAHWVTPVGETPRRFDTRFFLAVAPPDQPGAHDDTETVHSMWIRPADALGQAARGELGMMPPTIANLEAIAGCATTAEVLALVDAAGRPPRIEPRMRRDADGRIVGVAMPTDPDYADLA